MANITKIRNNSTDYDLAKVISTGTVTNLGAVPAKSHVLANISSNANFKMASNLNVGDSMIITCNPSISYEQIISGANVLTGFEGYKINVTSGKKFNLFVQCPMVGKYLVTTDTNDLIPNQIGDKNTLASVEIGDYWLSDGSFLSASKYADVDRKHIIGIIASDYMNKTEYPKQPGIRVIYAGNDMNYDNQSSTAFSSSKSINLTNYDGHEITLNTEQGYASSLIYSDIEIISKTVNLPEYKYLLSLQYKPVSILKCQMYGYTLAAAGVVSAPEWITPSVKELINILKNKTIITQSLKNINSGQNVLNRSIKTCNLTIQGNISNVELINSINGANNSIEVGPIYSPYDYTLPVVTLYNPADMSQS